MVIVSGFEMGGAGGFGAGHFIVRDFGFAVRSLPLIGGLWPLRKGRGWLKGRGAKLFKVVLACDAFHDREAKRQFVGRGVLNGAIGLVNAHKLRPLLKLFLGGAHFISPWPRAPPPR